MLQERAGHVVAELERRGDALPRDGAHAGGGGVNVFGRNEPSVGQRHGAHAAAPLAELEHIVQHVGADVHETVAAVVALAAAGDVTQLTNPALLEGAERGLHVRAGAALLVNGHFDALGLGFGDHGVGLYEVNTHRLLDLDVDAVLQDAHGQGVVQLGGGGDSYDVGLHLFDHLVEVV